MSESTPTIGIPNAKWWLPHSHVVIKEDFLAEDQEWIGNQTNRVIGAGTPMAQVVTQLGSANVLLVKRMVTQGVVAVKRANDRIKTVHLPAEAGQLLSADLEYIAQQIAQHNTPMTEEQQEDFLPSADEPSAAN